MLSSPLAISGLSVSTSLKETIEIQSNNLIFAVFNQLQFGMLSVIYGRFSVTGNVIH